MGKTQVGRENPTRWKNVTISEPKEKKSKKCKVAVEMNVDTDTR